MEVTLPRYWSKGKVLKQEVLDRSGLWVEHSPDDVKIRSITYFIEEAEFSQVSEKTQELVQKTKVEFEV